jgi:hypothetical protein
MAIASVLVNIGVGLLPSDVIDGESTAVGDRSRQYFWPAYRAITAHE